MNYLSIKAIKMNELEARVLWSVSAAKNGAILVRSEKALPDIEIIAELTAAKHLIMERTILGNTVRNGTGVHLTFSRGAIKKLATGKSAKKHLQKYAAFLSSRLVGAQVEVNKKMDRLPCDDTPASEVVSPDARTYIELETPAIGRVLISDHALQRFIERFFPGKQENALKSLEERLLNPELRPVKLPENVRAHKDRKYGQERRRVYRHPTDVVHFGVITRGEDQILVTVFNRNDTEISSEMDEAVHIEQ
ncbi:MAG TPA: hypothetical protein ENH62_15160 [Marinobacter sp.]|uniref:Uncharacterized protein n=1 Tax=marine sediment metagenome TaxID=412755 RepID=A0A0F9RM48_9ZZZZ|nr:hypothetical protein [Marinobacter sp.]|tara:strand:- start:208 stop:957 length:750 start_codon:yes stop_codon:yes gene_type:complete